MLPMTSLKEYPNGSKTASGEIGQNDGANGRKGRA
jgi:hypothetical protein